MVSAIYILVDARSVVDALVQLVTLTSAGGADSGRFISGYPKVQYPAHKWRFLECCTPWYFCHGDNVTHLSRIALSVLPISMLFAPPDTLLLLQAKHGELIFAPDAVIFQIESRLYARRSASEASELTKSLSDEFALPIVHSA